MRWLAAWVLASVVAFLATAPWDRDGGTLAAPADAPGPGTLTIVLGIQLVVAVSVSVAVIGHRRQHSL